MNTQEQRGTIKRSHVEKRWKVERRWWEAAGAVKAEIKSK